MLCCPINNVLVKIENRYGDELLFKSGVKLHIDPSWNPNFHATITGKVMSLPVTLTGDRRNITQQLEVGDEVIFSYKVVGDTSFETNSKAFRTVLKEGYMMEWQNPDKETLKMQMVSPEKKLWAAAYTDKYGDLIAGKTGSHGEVENWCAQFKFASGEGFTYDNEIEYEGEKYWKVDLNYIFAVKKDGHWKMLGDYVMIEPLVEKKPDLMESGLYRTESTQVVVREDKGWVRSISKHGQWLGLLPNDVVLFNGEMKENYNIEGLPHFIIRQRYLLGKEN